MNHWNKSHYKPESKKNQTPEQQIIKNYFLSKMFVRIFYNEFAFEWQWKKEDQIKIGLNRYTNDLERWGFIHSQLYTDWNDVMRESVMLSVPNFKEIDKTNPTIYTRTKKCLESANILIDILEEHKDIDGFIQFCDRLKRQQRAYKIHAFRIMQEETTQNYRLTNTPDGTLIEKTTIKYRANKIKLLEAREEMGQLDPGHLYLMNKQQLLIDYPTEQKGNQLMLKTNNPAELVQYDKDRKTMLIDTYNEIILAQHQEEVTRARQPTAMMFYNKKETIQYATQIPTSRRDQDSQTFDKNFQGHTEKQRTQLWKEREEREHGTGIFDIANKSRRDLSFETKKQNEQSCVDFFDEIMDREMKHDECIRIIDEAKFVGNTYNRGETADKNREYLKRKVNKDGKTR